MRTASLTFLVLAIACEAFAWWGLRTAAGRSTFDEMAGILPMAAAMLGGVFVLLGGFCFWRGTRVAKASLRESESGSR